MSTIRVEQWNRDDPDGPPTHVWEGEVPDIGLGDAIVIDGQRYVMDLMFLVAVDDAGNPVRARDLKLLP